MPFPDNPSNIEIIIWNFFFQSQIFQEAKLSQPFHHERDDEDEEDMPYFATLENGDNPSYG